MASTIITLLMVLALAVGALVFLYTGFNEMLAQNARLSRRIRADSDAGKPKLADNALVPGEAVLESVERYLTPQDEEQRSKVQKKLMLAGYRHPSAVQQYYAWKWGIALCGFVISSLYFATMMARANPILPIAGVSVTVLFSYFAADMWVMRQQAYRKLDIERSFPDALDLMLVCIEAGHGLDQAIHRVSREMSKSAPVLSTELALIVAELRAGKVRERVLADFAERTNVDDISAFVTVIKQADEFGVSIADTLRVYAREMRNKRYMRAEETANMMPIKLALGAIMFTIPPVVLILIGPSVILILREMAKASAGVAF